MRLLACTMLVVAAYLAYCEHIFQHTVRRERIMHWRRAMRAALHRRSQQRLRAAAQEPRVLGTLRVLQAAFEHSGQWSALLQLGDVYRTGSYPTYRPDPEMALRVYKSACGCPDPGVAGAAQTRYLQCRDEHLAPEDVAGAPLPRDHGMQCSARADAMIRAAPPASFGRPRVVTMSAPTPPPLRPPPPPVVVVSDAQNVHDHAVVNGLQKSLRDMPRGSADAVESVTMHILESDAPADRKADALAVLDTLSAHEHSTLKTSEQGALESVWARIQSFPRDKRDNAADILASQLASGVEDGSVVCSTGKIARIVGALDGMSDDAPAIKPMWAVREELGTMAARIRDAHEDDPEAARAEFRRAATQTYVADLGLGKDVVDAVVAEYSAGF